MTPDLAAWAAIVAQPVIGQTGHRLTHPGGAANPTRKAPLWITAKGVNRKALAAAHVATLTAERREDDSACGPVRSRPLKAVARPTGKSNVVSMDRRRTA
jgi:hypothetical protein